MAKRMESENRRLSAAIVNKGYNRHEYALTLCAKQQTSVVRCTSSVALLYARITFEHYARIYSAAQCQRDHDRA